MHGPTAVCSLDRMALQLYVVLHGPTAVCSLDRMALQLYDILVLHGPTAVVVLHGPTAVVVSHIYGQPLFLFSALPSAENRKRGWPCENKLCMCKCLRYDCSINFFVQI